jgi:DNA-binding cell septation regulator SpoVG
MDATDLVAEVNLYNGAGLLRAFADLTLRTAVGEITLKGYHVVANKNGGGVFVAPPSERYTTKAGEIKNKRIVEASRPTERRIADAVMEAYRKAGGVMS